MSSTKKSHLVLSLFNKTPAKRLAKAKPRLARFEKLEDRRLLASNQPPVNSVPGPQETQVNTPLAFTEFRENLLGVSDPDAGINKLRVTLAATHGNLSFVLNTDPNGGLTYSQGDGTEDATMTFTGTQANINEAFKWIVFNPEPDYIGTEAGITLTTNDQGFFGTGGAKEDVDFIPITTTAVPDFAPSPTYETLPAALDPTFDGDGIQFMSLSPGRDYIRKMLPLDDGRILAVGAVNDHFGLMRFLPDLTLDPTFGTGGIVESDFGAGNDAYTITIHPDGRLLVGGKGNLAMYSEDGVLDSTFGDGGRVTDLGAGLKDARGVEVQADGRIIITGTENGDFRLSRFLPDGVIESSSSYYTKRPDDFSQNLHLRDDGRVLLLGAGNYYNGSADFTTVRFNVFGNAEEQYGFPVNSTFYLPEGSISLSDGKILQYGLGNHHFLISRNNSNGSLDTSFGVDGRTTLSVLSGEDVANGVRLQPDGKILLVGRAHNGANNDFAIARLNYDGSPDLSFGSGFSATLAIELGSEESANDVVVLPDGKILIVGSQGNDIAFVRLMGDSDIISPTASLTDPADGASIDSTTLNAQGYLDVTFADEGNTGLDVATITDSENELLLSGPATAGVVLDGTPTLVSGSTYRYTFTGTFSEGVVDVEFAAGSFADLAANLSESAMESFTVTAPAIPSGDFDADGDIDGRDFLAWQRGFGIQSPDALPTDGDADGDKDVDGDDLVVWQSQYDTPPAPIAALSSSTGRLSAEDLFDLAFVTIRPTSEEAASLIVDDRLSIESAFDAAHASDDLALPRIVALHQDSAKETPAATKEETDPWLTEELVERVFG